MNAALVIIFLVAALAFVLGVLARFGKEMTLEQWTVGGRGFGGIFVFLLTAGEIYTTFTFLGGSGFAYGKGAAAYYILGYGALAYILSYWLLPLIWRYAQREKLISQPHFLSRKYDSPALGVLAAVVGVVALVPYLVLQFKGLGIIVSVASYGAISSTEAIWIGAAIITVYVMVSGVHGSAWNATVKDCLILVVVVFLGVYLPFHYYDGYSDMFHAIETAKPGFLALKPTGSGDGSVLWFQSTVLLTALGFYMWPFQFGALMTAKAERTFRRNAIIFPLYQLILLFVFFCGFAAILKVPGLTGGDMDLSLFRLSIQTFDPWVVGIIGGAGVLTALVPASVILIAASTLLANDVFRGLQPEVTDKTVATIARGLVPIIALIAVYFTLQGGQTIVALLLMGYSFVTQLFPAVIASLTPNNPLTKAGAFAGILAGVATVVTVTLTHSTIGTLAPFLPPVMNDINVGFVALILNIVVAGVVSVATRPASVATVERA
jgi:solute:Na+ symporter, SSS family